MEENGDKSQKKQTISSLENNKDLLIDDLKVKESAGPT